MGLPDRHNHGSEVMVKREMSSETVNACTLKGRLSAIYEDGGSLQTSYFNECIKKTRSLFAASLAMIRHFVQQTYFIIDIIEKGIGRVPS